MKEFGRQFLILQVIVSLVICVDLTLALVSPNNNRCSEGGSISRQDAFKAGFAGFAFLAGSPETAFGFDNKVASFDRPKRKGPKPNDLGVMKRMDIVGEEYVGLKHCGSAPNCFVSTDNIEDDPDHNIPSWSWPEEYGDDRKKAFEQLVSTINSYEPGQSNIDGGGFKIITNESSYIYTQFESLKNGYYDDLEVAYIDGYGKRNVQVRSSSRIGYLDFGVNAKRINYIAKDLRSKGWDAPGVEYKTHQNYAIQNEIE
jgi:uncharacterized protein (DUF1499 family)